MKEREAPESEKIDDAPFLSRWSKRKQAAVEQEAQALTEATEAPPLEAESPPLTDADMPPLESLDEQSDYSGFFSPEVTEELRQLALQKLFRSTLFNVRDGLDDYDDDFTQFEKLGDLITADLRHRLQMEADRAAERMQNAQPEPVDAADSTVESRTLDEAAENEDEEIADKAASADEADV
ncbi:MAG: DUF3306 domain-containing protein [Candidatus Thiodiazotropha sp.]